MITVEFNPRRDTSKHLTFEIKIKTKRSSSN